jgi:hypothetical protein
MICILIKSDVIHGRFLMKEDRVLTFLKMIRESYKKYSSKYSSLVIEIIK